jgi:cyclophilin family peptidyl-prolyl cis-trans isomerase
MKRFLAAAAFAASLASPALAQEGAQQVQAPQAGPVITLHTTMGDTEVTLDPAGAPKAAEQFLTLTKNGYFDNAAVYRVEPDFVIQFGDLDAKLEYRDPKLPPIPLETEHNRHRRGALSFAHADDPNSGLSTIFISLSENSGLDANSTAPPNTTGYAVFGHVTAGMDVVDAIGAVELAPEGGPFPGRLPKEPVIVRNAVVISAG